MLSCQAEGNRHFLQRSAFFLALPCARTPRSTSDRATTARLQRHTLLDKTKHVNRMTCARRKGIKLAKRSCHSSCAHSTRSVLIHLLLQSGVCTCTRPVLPDGCTAKVTLANSHRCVSRPGEVLTPSSCRTINPAAGTVNPAAPSSCWTVNPARTSLLCCRRRRFNGWSA